MPTTTSSASEAGPSSTGGGPSDEDCAEMESLDEIDEEILNDAGPSNTSVGAGDYDANLDLDLLNTYIQETDDDGCVTLSSMMYLDELPANLPQPSFEEIMNDSPPTAEIVQSSQAATTLCPIRRV